MYLLDANICIDFMHGHLPYAYDLMRSSDPRLFKIPAIVEGELRLGIVKSRQSEKTRWLVDEFMRIRGELEMAGKVIGPNDLLIAATALANNAVLVTGNVDEFKRVPGLSIESWYEMTWEELGMGPLAEPERL